MMKKNIKNIVIICMASIALTACNDWTEVENIKVNQPGVEDTNPELYAQYLQKLRTYKNTDHKMVYASFDNSVKTPFSRGHHLSDLPDSIDIVSLIHPDGLVEFEQKEIEEIRTNKSTRVVYTISYENIEENYNQMVKVNLEADENYEAPDFLSYVKTSVKEALQPANNYNYDGLIIGYIGKSPSHMMDEEKEELLSIQNSFFTPIKTWMEQHKDKIFTLEGKPQNLIDKTLLESFKHIILNTSNVTTATELSYSAEMAIMEGGVPASFIVSVNTTDPNHKETGLYDNGTKRALTEAAYWVSADASNYEKVGLAIYNVERDYYNVNSAYQYTREAIQIINPAAKK